MNPSCFPMNYLSRIHTSVEGQQGTMRVAHSHSHVPVPSAKSSSLLVLGMD